MKTPSSSECRWPLAPTAAGRWPLIVLLVAVLWAAPSSPAAPTLDARGNQFMGFSRFSSFEASPGTRPRELVLTSPVLTSRIEWNELIASWNAETPTNTYLRIEVRALYPERATKYYVMGIWSSDPARFPRESVLHQKDQDGDVATDTLQLQRPCNRLQVRLTLGGELREQPKLKFPGTLPNRHPSHSPHPNPQYGCLGKTAARAGAFPNALSQRAGAVQPHDRLHAPELLGPIAQTA